MIHVLYSRIGKLLPEDVFQQYLGKLPVALQEKNKRYRQDSDRNAHLIGLALLLEGFQRTGYTDASLINLQYTYYGKPYLPGIAFNISHSSDLVVCAVGRVGQLGIDVERIREIDLSLFKMVLDDAQWQDVYRSDNPYHSFFSYWTRKESVVKADGRGLSIPLAGIQIMEDKAFNENNSWHLKKLELDSEYSVSLCSDSEVKDLELHFVEHN